MKKAATWIAVLAGVIAAMISIGQAQGGEAWLPDGCCVPLFTLYFYYSGKTIRQAQTPKTLSSGFLQLSAAMT